jgi:hypothetical protein
MARVQEQIAEPPSTAAVGESEAKKPDFVATPSCKRGVDLVKAFHKWCDAVLVRALQSAAIDNGTASFSITAGLD